jgi:hypothetical protein
MVGAATEDSIRRLRDRGATRSTLAHSLTVFIHLNTPLIAHERTRPGRIGFPFPPRHSQELQLMSEYWL